MIIKTVSEMPETPDPIITALSEEFPDDEYIQIPPRVSEETTASEPPASADPPPVEINYEEPVQQDIAATAKEINERKLAMGFKTEVTPKASYQTNRTYEMFYFELATGLRR